MTDPMTVMFGPQHCNLCGKSHYSFNACPEPPRSDLPMQVTVAAPRPMITQYEELPFRVGQGANANTAEGKDTRDELSLALARQRELEEALREIVAFCDDPEGSEHWESLAMGLSRLLPKARALLSPPTQKA